MREGQADSPGLPVAPEDSTPRSSVWLWIQLVVAIGLVLLFVLALLGFLLSLTDSDYAYHGGSKSSEFVTAAICVLLLVLSVEWARRVAHRLYKRGGHPPAASLEAASSPSPSMAPRRHWSITRTSPT